MRTGGVLWNRVRNAQQRVSDVTIRSANGSGSYLSLLHENFCRALGSDEEDVAVQSVSYFGMCYGPTSNMVEESVEHYIWG